MIFVTVGTPQQSFHRLIRAVDEYSKTITEQIMIQTGNSSYIPEHANFSPWIDYENMQQIMEEARIIISHAGAGTIITAINLGKPLVLAPRLSQFSEHFNNHQLQIARALQEEGRAVVIENITPQAIADAISQAVKLRRPKEHKANIVDSLRQQLLEWS
jgi:beta-1,4-N-acetylglucosaminyltransferase